MDGLKIGDEAWVPRWEPRQVRTPCPLCGDNPAHTVTVCFSDGTEVATPCGYCGHGFEGPRGYTMEWEYGPSATRERVRSIASEETHEGRRVRYTLTCGHVAGPEDLFPDSETATAEAARRIAQRNDEEDARRKHRKAEETRRAQWNVGYHLREAKDYRRKVAYHEARAVVLRERNAVDKEQKQPQS